MGTSPHPQPPGRRAGAAVPVGLRRVDWVRVVVDGEHTTCEAHGVRHRLPAVQRVSLATALELADRGVPVVVRDFARAAS